MADFRRWIYALALVALLAGFTVPVSAQAPPLECIANAGVPPTIRAEGFTELLGDITLNCTGGVPTPAGQVVPPVNVTVTISTYLTSRVLATNKTNGNQYLEALLIIDEPHSAVNPTRPILNCGAVGASDSGPSGPDVCAIISTGVPANTYDGTQNGYGTAGGPTTCAGDGTPSANSYSCGRPNVFQGQTTTPAVSGQTNVVTWLGVPLDPPGTTTSRTIRITNIRGSGHDANGLASAGSFSTSYIQAQISINGTTSLSLNNPQQIVAFVGPGLAPSPGTGISATNFTFLQCQAPNSPTPSFTFTEGFASSWKAKNIAMIINQSLNAGNGIPPSNTNAYWEYNGTTINYPKDLNQNVPGAIYNTESGFMYPSGSSLDGTPADPNPNPPAGIGTVQVPVNLGLAMSNGTNIQSAGVADAGTRLQVQVSNIPSGVSVSVPDAIELYNGTIFSGVAVLTNVTDSSGDGPYNPFYTTDNTESGASSHSTVINPGAATSGMAVYEILFADPFSVESLTVPTTVSYTPLLASNTPTPGQFAQALGGFAPFGSSHTSGTQIPRFFTAQIPTSPNYFEINRCACDLLFPFVTNQGGYDTGIAIANTSMDNLPGSTAKAQFGGVEFWYYGTLANGGAAPPPQCTNVASPGTCPTPNATSASSGVGQVQAGQVLTYVLSTSNGGIGTAGNGLASNWAAGFQGYVIAQAQFQYCHGFAFIGAQSGTSVLNAGVSEGYLGLILDNGSWACAGVGHDVAGLCRTAQSAENLAH